MQSPRDSLLQKLVDLLDGVVEVFLLSVMEPLVRFHTKIDHTVEDCIRQFLLVRQENLPKWIRQEGAITSARMALVLPVVLFISWGSSFVASILVLIALSAASWERAVRGIYKDDETETEGDQVLPGEEESFGECWFFVK